MNGKIILNLAISLDGYIADENGGFDWIAGDGNSRLNTEEKWVYADFLSEIDVVVMGRKCNNATYLCTSPSQIKALMDRPAASCAEQY